MYIRGMFVNANIFKIETNHILPTRGKVLISEPFLCDYIFGRSVVLLLNHTHEGSSMGLVMNKPLPLLFNDIMKDLECAEDIPLYQGGPVDMDTLFYLHTLDNVKGALPISEGFYLNGNFDDIKLYISQGNTVSGKLRFFLGYAGWEDGQLNQEISENTWIVGKENTAMLMDENAVDDLWESALSNLGGKYRLWARFPQIPSLN